MAKSNFFQRVFSRSNEPNVILVFSVLLFSIFGLYWGSFDNPIVFDTAWQFTEKALSKGYNNLSFYLTFDTVRKLNVDFQIIDTKYPWQGRLIDFRSIPYFSFALMYKYFGTDWYWYRVTNTLMHVFNSFFLYIFLKNLFKSILNKSNYNLKVNAVWFAFFGAFVFAIHPVSVYATAYLIQRTMLFSVFFGGLSLISYLKGLDKGKKRYFLLSIFFFYFCLYSKEHAITFPSIILLLTLLKDPFAFKKYLKKYSWVFLLLLLIMVGGLLQNLGYFGRIYEPHGLDVIKNAAEQSNYNIDQDDAYGLSMITQTLMYFRYLFIWILPLSRYISIDIHLPFPSSYFSWPETLMVFVFAGYLVFNFWLLIKKSKYRILGFVFLSHGLLFLPELYVVRLSEQFVLYRSYFWMFGFYAILPILFNYLAKYKWLVKYGFIIVILYPLLLISVTSNRLKTFDSKISLWKDVIEKIELNKEGVVYKSYRPYNNLANKLTDAGRIDEAIPYYLKGIKLNPNKGMARTNLGIMFYKQKRYDEAIKYYNEAIKEEPSYVSAYVGLGLVAYDLGRYEEAVTHYKRGLKVSPRNSDALYDLANAYYKLKKHNLALKYYALAIKSDPNIEDIYYNMGLSFSALGKTKEAVASFENLLKKQPDHRRKIDAWFEMANGYYALKNYQKSARYYHLVLKAKPKHVDASYNLGVVYTRLEDKEKALFYIKNTLRINPKHQKSLRVLESFK
ncbi:hypothetical protein BVY03_01590 [bacterium K02(2017)]|nr:hypothetical protein BVY03_01590 [bacterium K02(2017)]